MRALLITTKYNHADGSPWLVSELVEELLRRGNEVTVINIDWSHSSTKYVDLFERSGLTYKYISPFTSTVPKIGTPLKWIFSSIKALPFIFGMLFRCRKFDLTVSFSPCVATYAIHPFLKLLSKKSLLIYWDFFPVSNQQTTKSIPNILMPLMWFVENQCVRRYNFLGLMSPSAITYARNYFSTKNLQRAFVLPIWTKFLCKPKVASNSVRRELGLSDNRVIFVFGGQLGAGRGIIELCKAVIDAYEYNHNIALLIIGDGSLSEQVKYASKYYPEVIYYHGRVGRAHYHEILTNSDVGVVVTDSGFTSPTFPSKCLDYMACELPILASVESATDFGEIVQNNGIGISCLAGDHDSIVAALVNFANNRDQLNVMGRKGNAYLRAYHSVESVCDSIVDLSLPRIHE
jgi:glycosyltransferase involved in cell wall biosynthesis